MTSRMKKSWVVGLVVLAFAVGGYLVAQMHMPGHLPDPTVELRAEVSTLPLKLAGGRPIVDLRINGQGPYPFILDTGAEGTVLSQSLADELKLAVMGEAKVGSPGSTKPLEGNFVRLDKLELGDLVLSGGGGVSTDLSSMSHVFVGPEAPRGALSLKNWKGILVTFNYPAAQIELRRGELPAADGSEVFQFGASDRLPSADIELGGLTMRANLDSGAGRGIVIPGNFATKFSLAAQPIAVEAVHTVDRESPATGATLNGAMKLGRYSFDKPELTFVDSFPVANLGYPVLRRFAMTVDWKNHRVRLVEPATPTT